MRLAWQGLFSIVMLPGINYVASEGCTFQFVFEEQAISAHVAMCRRELVMAVIYPWSYSDGKKCEMILSWV